MHRNRRGPSKEAPDMLKTLLTLFLGDVKKVVSALKTFEAHLLALAEKDEAKAKALFAKAESTLANATAAKAVAGVVASTTTPVVAADETKASVAA
jgi:hypothetical protein